MLPTLQSQGYGEGGSSMQHAALSPEAAHALSPFAGQEQLVGSPTSLQLPATPPAAPPLPARNTSSSPVRSHPGSAHAPGNSPGSAEASAAAAALGPVLPEDVRAAGLRLRNALSQPVPEVSLSGELMGGDGGLGSLYQVAAAGIPNASQVLLLS